MRIATISSGYEKANFFVREDLDTRIYFHHLEDAVGYMAKRGYVKMRGEEERDWRNLLRKAHGVVKLGPKKEKQRYTKGKLVLVLKKTISDHDDESSLRNKRTSSRPLLLENGPGPSSSSTANFSQSTYHTNHTDRTSLGKHIRGKYKSYSEKFLAEQEEDKRQYMLAIVEGRPLPDAYPSSDATIGGRLLLTDGSNTSYTGNTTTNYSSTDGGTTTTTTKYSTTDHSSDSRREDFKKSTRTMGSNRQGVYGGGVRYFTPDNDAPSELSEEEEEDSTTEEEDIEEETYDEENTHSERSDKEKEVIHCDGSYMDSMFSEEEEAYNYKDNAGVESVASETPSERSSGRRGGGDRGRGNSPKQGRKSTKNRSGTAERVDAPEMVEVSDDSASTNS